MSTADLRTQSPKWRWVASRGRHWKRGEERKEKRRGFEARYAPRIAAIGGRKT